MGKQVNNTIMFVTMCTIGMAKTNIVRMRGVE